MLLNFSRHVHISSHIPAENARLPLGGFRRIFSNSEFDGHFDRTAQQRMITGCRKLLPILEQYRDSLGDIVLECGPYLNPAIDPTKYSDKHVFYLDIDPVAIQKLSRTFVNHANVFPFSCNLDIFEDEMRSGLYEKVASIFRKLGRETVQFDSVVISQVLNYIDYKKFFKEIRKYLRPGALVFINNVIDYGIPALFSNERPGTLNETVLTLNALGFTLLEKVIMKTEYPEIQRNDRHILVLATHG